MNQRIPWRDDDTIRHATRLACDVRDLDPEEIAAGLRKLPVRKLVDLVLAAAAMVDIDAHVHELLAWDKRPPNMSPARIIVEQYVGMHCRQGHPRTPENTRVDRSGLHCRACHRESQRERRRRKANAEATPEAAA